MTKGRIVVIERPKGYGFIEAEDGSEVFFHQRWLRKVKFRDLNVGDEVVFAVHQGPRGLRAHNLTPASEYEEAKPRSVELLFKN